MSFPAFDEAIQVDNWGTSLGYTAESNSLGIRSLVTHIPELTCPEPHDNCVNIHTHAEQVTSSQLSNTLGNTSATSPSHYSYHNNIDATSLFGPEYLDLLSTPEQLKSSIYTGFPPLQHSLSISSSDNFASDNFQRNSTHNLQHVHLNTLTQSSLRSPSFSTSDGKTLELHPNRPTNILNHCSLNLCIRSNHEVADKLFTLIRTKLIEGKNVSMEYKPSLLKDSIQFFYRTHASGPVETLEFGLSIRKSIRDILLKVLTRDRDEKSSCILEVVDRAYYNEGWRLNSEEDDHASNHHNLHHGVQVSSAAHSNVSSQPPKNQFVFYNQSTGANMVTEPPSKKRPKEKTTAKTPGPQFKRQRPASSKPYECYCSKLFSDLKALRRHFNTHSPLQFVACPSLNCTHLSLRIDSIEDHLKIHHNDIPQNQSVSRDQTRSQLAQNTFLILDCTHTRCIVAGCERQFPHHELDSCKKSQKHILSHYKDPNSLPHDFRHLCEDDGLCNGKEAWRKSGYVTGRRIQKLEQDDCDDVDDDL